jgi:3-phosphoshikimate 1-carboxyvinyltransferase
MIYNPIYPTHLNNHTIIRTLLPAHSAVGKVTLPGSKSLSIRALLLASLSEGNTTLTNVLDSDDTHVMIAALRQLGVNITAIKAGSYYVIGGGFKQNTADIFVGNSGLSIRTLTAALAASEGTFRLHGVARMHERPIADLINSLTALNAHISYENTIGYPPLLIEAYKTNKTNKLHLNGTDSTEYIKTINVKGNASSQYLTGLLQIAPLLSVKYQQDITIVVNGELISKPYVDMTIQLMSQFNVNVIRDNTQYQQFTVLKNSRYHSPNIVQVEGDASSASYFLAAGALGYDSLTVYGIGLNSLQGDIHFATFLSTIGIKIDWDIHSITVHGRANKLLPAFTQDFNHIPDAAMTAAIIALFTDGPCVLNNIGSWRVKETDRLTAMATELRKIGAVVEEGLDYLAITPPINFVTANIHTYDDHRMAMCFSLLRFAGIPITIEDPDCVNKTFPNFFKALDNIIRQY